MCFLVIALIGLVVGVLVSIVPVIFEACGGIGGYEISGVSMTNIWCWT